MMLDTTRALLALYCYDSPSLLKWPEPTVHVYRNRADDNRQRHDLVFCHHCNGWYGVPHTGSHCNQHTADPRSKPGHCACRFCCQRDGRPIEGRHGTITADPYWTTVLDKRSTGNYSTPSVR